MSPAVVLHEADSSRGQEVAPRAPVTTPSVPGPAARASERLRPLAFSRISASGAQAREHASEELFPVIDPLQSSFTMATPGIVGEGHYGLAREIRPTVAQYAEHKDIIAMLGLEQLSPHDRPMVARARRPGRFLTQPFLTTERFTGCKGRLVSLADSLDGCERTPRDEMKDFPEQTLYRIGEGDEAKRDAKVGPPAMEMDKDEATATGCGTPWGQSSWPWMTRNRPSAR